MNTPTVPDGQTPPPLPPQYRDPRYGDYDAYGDYGEFGTAPYPAPQPTRSRILRATRSPTRSICRRSISTRRCRRPCLLADRATGRPSVPRDIVPAPRPIPPVIAAPVTRPINRLRGSVASLQASAAVWRFQRQPVVVPAALHPARHAGRAAGLLALYHPGAHHSATPPLN